MRKMSFHRALATASSYLGAAAFGVALAAAVAAVFLIIPPHAFGQTRPAPAPAPARAPAAAPAAHNNAAPAQPAAAQGADADNKDVIARVGPDSLTASDIRAYVATLDDRQQQALAHAPAALNQTVRALLNYRLVLQEALAKKWEQQPEVAAKLQSAREQAIVELYLQSLTTPPPDYPGDSDIQKAYDSVVKTLIVPRQFELAQIAVAVPQGADAQAEAAAKKKIDDFAAKLAAPGADFTTIAKTGNDAPNGGDIGWLPESQIRPEILSQVVDLAANAVGKPIRLDDGWHIFKLVDKKPAHAPTLAEVHDQLVQQLRAERATTARRAYLAQLLQQHPPMLNEVALSNLLSKSP